jgi:hypothetical protein
MHVLVASLILSVTWMIWIWAYAAHRRPEPLAWTRYSVASIAVLLVVVCLLPMGIGYLAVALMSPLEMLGDLGIAQAALVVGTPLLAVFATPRLLAPMRQPRNQPVAVPAAVLSDRRVALAAKA